MAEAPLLYLDGSAALRRRLIRLPPQMEPVVCKPLVFDLADDFLEYPSLEQRIAATQATGTGAVSAVAGAVGGVLKSLTGGWGWG